MAQYYDFLDHKDFLKKKQKKNATRITEFDKLLAERDQFYVKFFLRAWDISEGNISAMARGLRYSKRTLEKYLIKIYGIEYRGVLDTHVKGVRDV